MNRDFRDLLAEFNAHGVEYLIVGAHGHIRATKELDVWIRADSANAERVIRALTAFGTPLRDLTGDDLVQPGLIFQIGVPPVRIDLVTSIDGATFSEGWPARVQTTFADQPVAVLRREHLIRNKRASGRTQNLADAEWLEARSPNGGER